MKEERYEILRNINQHIDNYDWELKQLAMRMNSTSFFKLSKYEHWLIAVSLAGEIIRKWGDEAGDVDEIFKDYYFDFLDYKGNAASDTREVAEQMQELYKEIAEYREGK